jgi:hypothetical protein
MWLTLGESAMSQFYDPSDWAFAWLTCEVLHEAMTTRNTMTGQLNATLIQAGFANLSRLGVTEGDRRRLRVEIEQGTPVDDPKIAILDNYRKQLTGAA